MFTAPDDSRLVGYARVSTGSQDLDLQLDALQKYGVAKELIFTDKASGATRDRAGLDACFHELRHGDVLLVWRLDRLGRNLRHLVTLLEDLESMGIGFVSLGEGIDATTPAGRLQMHILAALAEFERARIAERVRAGLARARAAGTRLGRPRRIVPETLLAPLRGLSIRQAAVKLGVSSATAHRWLRGGELHGPTLSQRPSRIATEEAL